MIVSSIVLDGLISWGVIGSHSGAAMVGMLMQHMTNAIKLYSKEIMEWFGIGTEKKAIFPDRQSTRTREVSVDRMLRNSR